jgi:hypothetical protein
MGGSGEDEVFEWRCERADRKRINKVQRFILPLLFLLMILYVRLNYR